MAGSRGGIEELVKALGQAWTEPALKPLNQGEASLKLLVEPESVRLVRLGLPVG